MIALRRPGWLSWRQALLGLLMLGTAETPAWPDEIYRANAVKAAFLFRFTSYVDWPSEAMTLPVFTIAVLGSDAVAEELGLLLPKHMVKNLPAQVRSIRSVDEAAGAQLLYVGVAYHGDLRDVTAALMAQPVLIVTDHARGLDEGGMVNFMLVDQRVRFEISLPAATQAGLKLGPALLSVATRVLGAPRSALPCSPSPVVLVMSFANEECATRVAGL